MDGEVHAEIEKAYVDCTFKKGTFLLKPGQVCTGHYMITEGIARKYFKCKEKEITSSIYFEGSVAISLDSYILQTKSSEFIEAITSVKAIKVDYQKFQAAKRTFPEIEVLDRLFVELHAVWIENQLRESQTLSATERYLKLLEENPKVIRHIPLTIIASYLNISLATLSRIRANIVRDDYLT